MSGIDDLRQAVEELRREAFPDLSEDLVVTVLQIEADHVEDRGPAPRLIEAAVDASLEGE